MQKGFSSASSGCDRTGHLVPALSGPQIPGLRVFFRVYVVPLSVSAAGLCAVSLGQEWPPEPVLLWTSHPVPSTDRPPSEVLISHSREGADCVSLIGSSVLSRAVSDGMFSKKRVSQAGPREAFAFSANRCCPKQQDPGCGAPLCLCAFAIITCFEGQHLLPVRERG